MAKAKEVMTFTIGLTRAQLNEILDATVDHITDNYTEEEVKLAGVDMKKLRAAVADDPKFYKELQARVAQLSQSLVESVTYGDYIDSKLVTDAYNRISKDQDERYAAEEAAREAEREQIQVIDDAKRLKAAIELLRANGYEI